MFMSKKKEISRRDFLATAAAGGAACAIVPRNVLGRGFTPPSDTLNIAAAGVGGMGRSNLINLASQNIVAMCDVDWDYAQKGFDQLDTELNNQQQRASWPADQPYVDSQGRALPPLTARDRRIAAAQVEGIRQLKA